MLEWIHVGRERYGTDNLCRGKTWGLEMQAILDLWGEKEKGERERGG